MTMSPRIHAQQFLEYICPEGATLELRAFSSKSTPQKKVIIAGQFNDTTEMGRVASILSEKRYATDVYFTLNSIKPEAQFQQLNMLFNPCARTVRDREIAARNLYLIDCDPDRPSGVCATDDEKARAMIVAQGVIAYLTKEGWPEPIMADSGNGYHLYYRGAGTDPAGTTFTWKQCLMHLGEKFNPGSGVKIDPVVFNEARISRMPGTWNRKGDDTSERPHRMAQVISYPEKWEPVTTGMLVNLANQGRSDVAAGGRSPLASMPALKVSSKRVERVVKSLHDDLIEEYPETFELHQVVNRPDGVYIGLAKCPFKDDEHNGQLVGVSKSCIIVDKQTGQIGFKCFSDDCADYGFGDLMHLIQEQYDEQPIFSFCTEVLPFEDQEVPYIRYLRLSPGGWQLEARVNTLNLTWDDVEDRFIKNAIIADGHMANCKPDGQLAFREWVERVIACRDLDAAASLLGQGWINSIAFPCEKRPLSDGELADLIRDVEHPRETVWIP